MKTVLKTFLLLSITASLVVADDSIADNSSQTELLGSITVVRSYYEPQDFRNSGNFTPVRIGLALSGGGARGMAQIGVLKAFEDAGLDISYIAGTSMGSVIGGLYASGYSAGDIETLFKQFDFASIFSDSPQRKSLFFAQRTERDRYLLSVRFAGFQPYIPRGLAAGQRLTSLLTDLTISANYSCENDFRRLKIPFRAVATDIGSGKAVYLDKGSLADAMRASMAFPLAFTPVELDGRYLMDGGIMTPVPVTACQDMGADFVVAINTASGLMPAEQVNDPIDVAGQVTTIMSQNAKAEQLAQADVIIGPELLNLRTFDFQLQDSLVALGYKAGEKAVHEIKQKIAGDNHEGFRRLDYVMLARNDDWLQYLKQNFPIEPGDYFKPGSLDKALEYADRQMHFNRLTADIQRLDGKTAVVLDGQLNHTTDVIEFKFVGNTTLSDSIMLSCFANNVRGVLSLAKVKKDADSLIRIYKRQGHDLAHIRHIHYDHDAGVVIVVIDEGRLRYVDIRGNERTRDWVIKANYPLRPGAPFDTEQSETGIAQIYGTGFFDRVSLDFQPTDDGVHLTINVKEKKFTQLRLGAHWDDEYQGEMFAELLDDNVFGAGLQALGHARVSSRRYEYYLSFKANRLSQTLFMARAKLYFSRLRRRLFQDNNAPDGFRVEDRLGFSINLGQQIERFGNFYFQYRVEDIKTTLTIPDIENDEVLTVFAIKSAVETFNRFPFPDKGHRQDIAIEFCGKSLGGTYDEYTKLSGSIEEYFPVGKYLNLHPKITAGISTADLPDVEKFYIGGMYDFFGFRTHQLSGDKLFVFSMQARLRLPYRFYLIGEYDYGNVFDDYENIKIREFRNGWGLTIALDTPLGPFEFGYGKAEQTPDRLYLNLGLRF